jgi:pepF/M3 family oligoendopeptidase
MPTQSATAAASTARTVVDLPRWDVSSVYPALDSPEFAAGFAATLARIDDLAALFDAEGVGRAGDSDDAIPAQTFERVLDAYNTVLDEVETLEAFLYAFVTTDSRDEAAQARMSELEAKQVTLAKLHRRWDAWIGAADIGDLIRRSPSAAAHAHQLERSRIIAAHQMSAAEEDLAAELAPSAGGAWERLYDTVTSQIEVDLDQPAAGDDLGGPRRLPMSELRTLAMNPHRAVRQAAFAAEVAAWEHHAAPLAAALNGIKGQAIVLAARRCWDDPLDEAVFVNAIDRDVLVAMTAASRAAFPDFRRYLHAKAAALGLNRLAWFDLFAPVGSAGRVWTWEEGIAFLDRQFGAYSDRLRDLLRRSVAERWIDAGPRPGKTDGAFCMWLRDGESRVLHNWSNSYDAVSTLAHELGHAYHNLNQTGLTPIQRVLPMTLAETASTFCETLVKEAVLAEADDGEALFITEQSLQGSTQVVVDILSRFAFEQAVFARRRERDLVVTELCDLMLAAQRDTYGDGLDASALHPWMWAAKSHYYGADFNFYNVPYLFGLLFGLGLFARFREDPTGFRFGYDDLLRNTGLADAPTLAGRWGIDLRDEAFWRSSLDVIRADIARFERLAIA